MSSSPPNTAVTTPLLQDAPKATERNTYSQILKSSALIGGSQVVNIAIGIVRTKAMAVLLGPGGFGLMGLYGSISNLAQSIAGMGINSSGVRQIAEAVGTGENERIARTVAVLRRTSIILGLLGAVLLVAFCRQIATLTFGDDQHATDVALLACAVFFSLVSGAQGALIQGMRRIADLARMGILGAFFGTIISISLVYLLREKGVVPALVGIAAMSIVTSWWYSRKVQIDPVSMSIPQVRQEAAGLLKLGFAFMASGFLIMGAAYAVRIIVLRQVGLEAAGLYQSAWTLAGLYVGLVLQAMGADFYPRLTAVAKDNSECNRLVNEQAHVSLLLAVPGAIATVTFAPLVISLFYSAKFGASVGVLRWICLGMIFQVISWPMGFIILAKGEQNYFFWSELAWTVVNVGLAWICVRSYDLNGAGIAFFGSYVFHGLMINLMVRRLSGFRWSAANRQTGLLFLSLVALVCWGFYVLPVFLATGMGALATFTCGVYSIRTLLNLIPFDRIPPSIQRLLVRFRLRQSCSI